MNNLNYVVLSGKILEDARVRAFDENMTDGVVDTKLEFFTVGKRDEYGNLQKTSNIINIRFKSGNINANPAGKLKRGEYINILNGQLLQEVEADSFGNRIYHNVVIVKDWQRSTKINENSTDSNYVVMCGNLTEKPLMKEILKPSGDPSYFIYFTICLNYDTSRDENGLWQSKSSFIKCKYFSQRKEDPLLTKANKGDRILIHNGEMRMNVWDKNGERKESIDVNIRSYELFARANYQMFGSTGEQNNNNYTSQNNSQNNFNGSSNVGGYNNNTRINNPKSNNSPSNEYYPPSLGNSSSDFMDDDIPF